VVRQQVGQQSRGWRVEPNDESALVQQGTVFGAWHDPAAGRDNCRRAIERTTQRRSLHIAEARLALLGKNLGDLAAGRAHNQHVRVEQRPVEPLGQQPPDRRLAATAQADQGYRALVGCW
jgi:hypothetical protein